MHVLYIWIENKWRHFAVRRFVKKQTLVLLLFFNLNSQRPETLGGGVRAASQNPYPIFNQNLRFPLPYVWPDQKFDTLFMIRPFDQYSSSDLPYN